MQDFGQTDVRAADFLINGRKLYLAAADAGQTLRLWSYEQHARSWGGKRLLPLCALGGPGQGHLQGWQVEGYRRWNIGSDIPHVRIASDLNHGTS